MGLWHLCKEHPQCGFTIVLLVITIVLGSIGLAWSNSDLTPRANHDTHKTPHDKDKRLAGGRFCGGLAVGLASLGLIALAITRQWPSGPPQNTFFRPYLPLLGAWVLVLLAAIGNIAFYDSGYYNPKNDLDATRIVSIVIVVATAVAGASAGGTAFVLRNK